MPTCSDEKYCPALEGIEYQSTLREEPRLGDTLWLIWLDQAMSSIRSGIYFEIAFLYMYSHPWTLQDATRYHHAGLIHSSSLYNRKDVRISLWRVRLLHIWGLMVSAEI